MSKFWASVSVLILLATAAFAAPARANPGVPTDPGYAQQWNLMGGGINVAPVWELTHGAGVTVAVIGSGSTPNPDLVWTGGYDFFDDQASGVGDGDGWDADPTDPGPQSRPSCESWHGTKTASIIGAQHNDLGIAGIAPDATLVPIRALDGCGNGNHSDLATAIRWASGASVDGAPVNPNPARVIYVSHNDEWSWWMEQCPSFLRQAYEEALARGAVIVAAGSDFNTLAFDCGLANLINVRASDSGGSVAWAYGSHGAIVAPGQEVPVLDPASGATMAVSGSDFAAAHVAGVAALLIAADPDLDAPTLLAKLAFAQQPKCDGCPGVLDASSSLAHSGNPIEDKWLALGGAQSFLGEPVGGFYQRDTSIEQAYASSGVILWTSGFGAWPLFGAVKARVHPALPLGPPTSGEIPAADGVLQHFASGDVYWSARTGARFVTGPVMQDYYNNLNGPAGYLGFPVGDEFGNFRDAYPAQNFVWRRQNFERGWVYWDKFRGPFSVHGGVFARHTDYPMLGNPRSQELPIPGGVVQYFDSGEIYWTPATAGLMVFGGVRDRYIEAGRHEGYLGAPISEERPVVGGVVQHFQRGDIYWHPSYGAYSVHGGIAVRYEAAGRTPGYLGFPISSEESVTGGVRQRFERGHIYWGPTSGAYTVHGGVLTAYLGAGGPDSRLGLPTSSEIPTGGGVVQYFQHGWIGWTPAGSGVHVTS